jgi:mannose-6-phosphate isomerase-like protein (cupin superfamily)
LKFSNPTPGETGQYQSLLAEPSKTQEIYVFLDGMRKKGTVTLAWKSNQRPELVAANDVVAVPPPGEPFLHEQV